MRQHHRPSPGGLTRKRERPSLSNSNRARPPGSLAARIRAPSRGPSPHSPGDPHVNPHVAIHSPLHRPFHPHRRRRHCRSLASARRSDLIPLVPPNAQLVSGIADPGHGSASGRLLATTAANNRDLRDLLSLTSSAISTHPALNLQLREVIVVASSSNPGDLTRHLLLVSGHFNAALLRQAALARGAQTLPRSSIDRLALPPDALDHETGVRWIAFLNDRIVLVGTPALVTAALDRWQQNTPADPVLLQRLAYLPDDVNSWSTIALPAPLLASHLAFLAGPAPLASALHSADEVELGVHYGPMARIDFSVHQPSNLQETAAPHSVPAAFTVDVNALAEQELQHPNRVHGSITVSAQTLDAWISAWAQFPALPTQTTEGAR